MGKLIVFEGTDGTGKSTQYARACKRLEAQGVRFQNIKFPQYDEPSSALIKMYLAGEFGKDPDAINPYAASTFYAVDRYAALAAAALSAAGGGNGIARAPQDGQQRLAGRQGNGADMAVLFNLDA